MGYHTHFYVCDATKSVEQAKEILALYRKQLCKELDSIPNDDFFKKIYKNSLEMVTDEKYQEFKELSAMYKWPQSIIDSNEEFFAKHRNPDYKWEDEKNEWIQNLKDIENTGLLTIFDFDTPLNQLKFLIDNYSILKRLDIGLGESLPRFVIKHNKLYSGEIFKRFYRVRGYYCQSKWYNPTGVIHMIEDYPDRVVTDEEKQEIEDFFKTYPDCYCWII